MNLKEEKKNIKKKKKSIRFQCVKCGHCCTNQKIIVNLTHKDLFRLEREFNLKGKDLLPFIGFYLVEGDYSEEKIVFPPIKTTKGNAYLGLKKTNEGYCIFLEPKSKVCLIHENRPQICRTFPFTYNMKNGWLSWGISEAAKDCIGLGKGKKISKKHLEMQGTQTIKELEEFKIIAELWNDYIELKKLSPTPHAFLEFMFNLQNSLISTIA